MTEDLLAPDLQQLIQLFTTLPNVRFPDLDASALHDAVAKVKERHLEVLHVEAQLAASRGALDEEQEALLKKGHRLLAYLKVFAENDEALAQRLSGLSLPRVRKPVQPRAEPTVTEDGALAAPPEAPKKRGRPRKVQPSTSEVLFAEAPTAG
jgi:hypothetical protein